MPEGAVAEISFSARGGVCERIASRSSRQIEIADYVVRNLTTQCRYLL